MPLNDCRTQAAATTNTLKTCLDDAVTVEEIDDCLDAFEVAIPDCVSALEVLDSRGSCYSECGDDFIGDEESCIQDPGQTGTDCVNAFLLCVGTCP